MARPSSYTQEIADEICSRLVETESLRGICKDEHMPSVGTVCRWLGDNKPFQEQYARARGMQTEVIADETFEMVDDGSNDWMEKVGKDGSVGYMLNGEAVARSRLRFDQRRWWLSKLAPKKYGDKLEIDATVKAEVSIVIGGDAS